jgi:hypothetical protein
MRTATRYQLIDVEDASNRITQELCVDWTFDSQHDYGEVFDSNPHCRCGTGSYDIHPDNTITVSHFLPWTDNHCEEHSWVYRAYHDHVTASLDSMKRASLPRSQRFPVDVTVMK